jgi:hypothetical protein
MRTIFRAAAIAVALVSWQPSAHAATIGATSEEAQPLTRAACDQAGLAWDDNGNVCDWQSESPKERLASEPTPDVTGAISSVQPLTRADCNQAGLARDDNGNICDWQPQEQLASEPDITEAITSAQPLNQAGLAWDDDGNVCDWQSESSNEQLASEATPDITGAITSGQPLTRTDCDKAGLP